MFAQGLFNAFDAIGWATIGKIANHLWQSTAFAGICWLAVSMLRKNAASLRHRIWLVASLKFLVPFSLLVTVGGHFGGKAKIEIAGQALPAVRRIGAPFAATSIVPPRAMNTPAPDAKPAAMFPLLIAAIWFAGGIAATGFRLSRWRRLAVMRTNEVTLHSGREADALARVQRRYGWRLRIRMTSTSSALEPAVRGLLRPVLSLPAGICDYLDEQQLDAVITHELCHVRRRDNLFAALQVIAEALFWFHPLLWWISSRLIIERERACDETVVELGNDAHTYAQAVLRVCEFYVLTPMAVSRVTGSNLSRRIEEIMTQRRIHSLGIARWLLLTTAGIGMIAVPVGLGLAQTQQVAPLAGSSAPNLKSSPSDIRATVAASPVARTSSAAPARVIPQPQPPAPTPSATIAAAVPGQDLPPAAPKTAADTFILGPQDELEIVVWHQTEISRRVVVRPDGKIGVPLLNDVQAAGLTPIELSESIQRRLKPFISEAMVSVIVVAAKSSQVTIQGAVGHPGQYLLNRTTTLIELLAQAGGLTPFAQSDRVSIIRQQNGKAVYHTFNFTTFMRGSFEQNIVLMAGDIVIVP